MNVGPDIFAVLLCIFSRSSSPQGWEDDTWDATAAWTYAEV